MAWFDPTGIPLDRWRLSDACRRMLWRAVVDADVRAAQATRLDPCLERGNAPGALAVLAELRQTAAAPEVGEFAVFLTNHAAYIPDYAARRAAGVPIGSGGVENGVYVVVNRRFKGKRGMKWGRARAEGVLALRAAELNHEWLARLNPALYLPPRLPAF